MHARVSQTTIYGYLGICANSVYQALSTYEREPGDEANIVCGYSGGGGGRRPTIVARAD